MWAAIVPVVLKFLGPALETLLGDKAKAQELVQQLQLKLVDQANAEMESEAQNAIAQLNVNAVEAASSDAFARDWRPFIGWVCGSAFAINYVVGPLVVMAAGGFGVKLVIPPLDTTVMLPVLLGMLGLGSLRTFEKVQGVTK